MTDSPASGVVSPPPPADSPKLQRPRWLKPFMFTIAGIVVLIAGIVIGSVSQQSTITSYKNQVAQLQGKVSTDNSKVTTVNATLATTRTQLSTAQSNATNALSIATAKVKAQYKSKFAALQAAQQKVSNTQARLNRELGVVAKSTISADGVYVVGRDIPSGLYHTSGGNQCYYATLGSTDTSNIMDNNNFNGPETVDVSGAYAFQIQGGCTWHKIG